MHSQLCVFVNKTSAKVKQVRRFIIPMVTTVVCIRYMQFKCTYLLCLVYLYGDFNVRVIYDYSRAT